MDQDDGVVQDGFHLLGVGDHVGGHVAPVELHAFHDLGVGLSGLGLLDGDDAVVGDLFHGLGDELSDGLVTGGDSADTGDVLGAADGLAVGFDGLDSGLGGLGDAFLHDHGVGACGQVLDTLGDDGLGQQGGGGGAVAGHVVGLGGHFLDHGCAHVLKRVVQLNFLGDGDAVVGDQGGAVFLIQDHVAALGAHGDFNGIGQLVYAGLECAAGFFAVVNEFCHNEYLRMLR